MSRKAVAFLVLMAALVIAAIGALAQEKETGLQQPAMPDEVKKLDAFIGDWHGTGKMTYMGKSYDVTIHHKCTRLPFGWGVQIEETNEIPDAEPYQALDVFGYDMGGGQFHLYTVSNYGDTHDHAGNWVDDKTLRLVYSGKMEGQPFAERLSITIDSPNQYSFTDSVTVGNELAQVFSGTMKK